MCGIAGLVVSCEIPEMGARLEVMTDVLTHRGPDDRGLYLSPPGHRFRAGLGHRRLSIIDLGGGHQPMANETDDIWITYNGEIYNHRELRTTLEAHGHRYRTQSDTETIVHAYEQYGMDCVHHLRGMWAFAIWDETRQRLFVARDRLGIKPLYYAEHDGVFYFASEIKALLASRVAAPEVNDDVLPEFLTFGYTCGEATLFRGIRKLMPGHWLTWDGDTVTVQAYWDWQFDEGQPYRDESVYQEEFEARLDESVRLRLMSEVPLGMFFSGGIDSSIIAACMARHVSTPIKTFAVGFESQYYSEFSYARTVAVLRS
ncbi:asparagine synthase (glutamine-hydrolyzing) [Candidatus Entotheonella serta]|nr:asparagine synthase (glutamine-hydrolyzing) [Candidatus Entotheonella serta]